MFGSYEFLYFPGKGLEFGTGEAVASFPFLPLRHLCLQTGLGSVISGNQRDESHFGKKSPCRALPALTYAGTPLSVTRNPSPRILLLQLHHGVSPQMKRPGPPRSKLGTETCDYVLEFTLYRMYPVLMSMTL